jgi:hypothetical protein
VGGCYAWAMRQRQAVWQATWRGAWLGLMLCLALGGAAWACTVPSPDFSAEHAAWQAGTSPVLRDLRAQGLIIQHKPERSDEEIAANIAEYANELLNKFDPETLEYKNSLKETWRSINENRYITTEVLLPNSSQIISYSLNLAGFTTEHSLEELLLWQIAQNTDVPIFFQHGDRTKFQFAGVDLKTPRWIEDSYFYSLLQDIVAKRFGLVNFMSDRGCPEWYRFIVPDIDLASGSFVGLLTRETEQLPNGELGYSYNFFTQELSPNGTLWLSSNSNGVMFYENVEAFKKSAFSKITPIVMFDLSGRIDKSAPMFDIILPKNRLTMYERRK